MRHRSKTGMVRAVALGTLAAGGLLMIQGRAALAQGRVSNAGDTTRESRPGQSPATRGDSGLAQDTRMLIAHGLEMAIEGSTLQALAMQSGGIGGSPGLGAPAAARTGSGVGANVGEAVPGSRAVTSGAGIAGTTGATGSVATGGTGVPTAPAAAGQYVAMLLQQAQHSFGDSERLLGQAGRDGASDTRLQQAATRYTAALRSMGTMPAGRVEAAGAGNGTGGPGTFPSATSVTGLGGTGEPVAGPGAGPVIDGGATVGPTDLAAVGLINHGVKEALGSMKIRQLVRAMGSSDSPAAQLLLTHAGRMEETSRSTVQAIAGSGVIAGPSGAANAASGGRVGTVQALAHQANELILALQGFGAGEGGLNR